LDGNLICFEVYFIEDEESIDEPDDEYEELEDEE
jgi:hypothetical protein